MDLLNLNGSVLIKVLETLDAEVCSMAGLLKVEILNSKILAAMGRQLAESLRGAELVAQES
jgi:hypothetical protein